MVELNNDAMNLYNVISALPATSLLEELADIREQVAVQAPVRVRSKVHHDLLNQLGVVAEPETARALEVLARRVEPRFLLLP